ncbi:hypothetical protein T265_12070 [Opisthorchis viverrini]|uniref:Uncharacterized protein n=1 Tax=Opisthorchis viverrini TaxID=6198 RepID=A0A074Z0H6_OPIVI|nr:hypothetical protein T265_12070 [Opisthorchis viverrini]KER18977.1 hypothetical protein T265_12070 [Opisthorchis viverrini]
MGSATVDTAHSLTYTQQQSKCRSWVRYNCCQSPDRLETVFASLPLRGLQFKHARFDVRYYAFRLGGKKLTLSQNTP